MHDDVDALHRLPERAAVTNVALDRLDLARFRIGEWLQVVRDDPVAKRQQMPNKVYSQKPRAACDQDALRHQYQTTSCSSWNRGVLSGTTRTPGGGCRGE